MMLQSTKAWTLNCIPVNSVETRHWSSRTLSYIIN